MSLWSERSHAANIFQPNRQVGDTAERWRPQLQKQKITYVSLVAQVKENPINI